MQPYIQQPQAQPGQQRPQPQRIAEYIIMGGAAIALIGFLFVPYMTMTTAHSSYSSGSTETYSGIQAASIQGLVWLEFLLPVTILGIALLLAFSRNPFGMSQLPRDRQMQRGIYTLIGIGVVALLLQYVVMTSVPNAYVGMYSTNVSLLSTALSSYASYLSMSYAAGSWFYVVGILAVLGGAGYALSLKNSALAVHTQSPYAQPGQSSPYQPNISNQPMGWQQPPMTPSSTPAPPSGAMPTYLQAWQSPDQSNNQSPAQSYQQPYQQPYQQGSQPSQEQIWQQVQQPRQGQYSTQQGWQQQPQSETNYPQQQQNWDQSGQGQQPPYPPSSYGQ